MIVERNNKSTTKGERKITLLVTNCGTIEMLFEHLLNSG
jgi:hypothetical protein